MRLPSENVHDVLQCVDFATLLSLQRSGSAFFGVVHRNQTVLPRLRVLDVYLNYFTGVYELQECIGAENSVVLKSRSFTRNADDIDYSLLRSFPDTIGTNFVDSASIVWTIGPRMRKQLDMQKAVEALPALKHVRKLTLTCKGPLSRNFTIDRDLLESLVMKPLDNLQHLSLGDVDNQTDWAFLRNEWALRLRSLSVAAHVRYDEAFLELGYPKIDSSGQAEFLEYCTDFMHLPNGKSKTVRLFDWRVSRKFVKRIVKTVAECNNWLSVVICGAPSFTGDDADYARFELPPDNIGYGLRTEVRYSSRVGSHRVFVETYPEGYRSIVVTNNPFITSFRDPWKHDVEAF